MLLSFFHTRTWMRGLHVYSCGLIDILCRSIQNNIYKSARTSNHSGAWGSLVAVACAWEGGAYCNHRSSRIDSAHQTTYPIAKYTTFKYRSSTGRVCSI